MDVPDIHVRIPRKLYELINELVVKEGHYRGAPEFILECTRMKLEEIKKYNIDKRKVNVYWHNFKHAKEKEKEEDRLV